MEINWVNHASFITSHNGVNLICDPWLEGTAFDKGWALLSQTVFPYSGFKEITHIWFSHEHPDHFSPPCIAKIPIEFRKNITILFQDTGDKKVVEYCKKMEFKEVVEMIPAKYYQLADDFACSCNHFTEGDSWLHIKTNKHSILNLNDCSCGSTEDSQSILNQLKGDVEVLVTQFGYANRIGNKDQTQLRKQASLEKLNSMKKQASVFRPKVIIPFASYIYFCHEDNNYMNDAINKIANVHQFIENEIGVKSNVMYPGDKWILSEEYNSDSSINKYNKEYERLDTNHQFIQSKKIELSDLQKMSEKFKNSIVTMNKSFFINFFTPLKIYIEDYNQSYSFDLKKGLLEKNISKEKCDISLKSDALLYCFTHLWGGDTLQVNGRFQTPAKGNYAVVRQYFKIASWNNRGIVYAPSNFIKSIAKVQVERFKKV